MIMQNGGCTQVPPKMVGYSCASEYTSQPVFGTYTKNVIFMVIVGKREIVLFLTMAFFETIFHCFVTYSL